MILPWYHRQRTERDCLLSVIRMAERHGWKHTLQQAQEAFYLLETGRIDHAF